MSQRSTASRRALEVYNKPMTVGRRLELAGFCLWLRSKGIPIEMYSLLEKRSGYIHAMALMKSGFLKVDFGAKLLSFRYRGSKVTMSYGEPIFFRGGCSSAASFLFKTTIPFSDSEAVLDFGAATGDTPILAALSGAKLVHAYEAYPFPYSLLVRNIGLNGLGAVIKPFNEAMSGNRGTVMLSGELKDSIGATLKSARGKVRVRRTTLQDAVDRLGNRTFMLKCNVEGHEREIFADAGRNRAALKNCRHARIAWHFKEYPQWLLDRMPSHLEARVLEGRSLSTGDHPYTILLDRP